MEKKLGFFETYNKASGMIEKSSTRLQQFLMLLFVFAITVLYVKDKAVDVNFIVLDLLFLVAAFIPKYLKDMLDIKDKLQPKK